MRNPNETKGENVESIKDSQSCSVCGMKRDTWKVNDGQGVKKGSESFCCKGCADGTGCTCT